MLRISLASVSTGLVFVIVGILLHCWYILQQTGGYKKGYALGNAVLFPSHPFLYFIPIFLIGLYLGGRVFK